MSPDIGLIFTAVEVGRAVAEFAGILESIEAKSIVWLGPN